MSSVSSIGDSSLYQWLQQLSGNSSTSASITVQNPSQTPGAPTMDAAGATTAAAGGHHHHHHGLSQQVESAVTTALQNAPSGSDPNQVIKDALAQVLQKNKPGQDADGDNDGSSAVSGTSAAASGATSSGASGASTIASNNSAFAQLLSSYGVTTQQFQQDLQQAMNNGQNGTPDFATLFQSFPAGTLLQTVG